MGGEAIPLAARIFSIIDVYDALTDSVMAERSDIVATLSYWQMDRDQVS